MRLNEQLGLPGRRTAGGGARPAVEARGERQAELRAALGRYALIGEAICVLNGRGRPRFRQQSDGRAQEALAASAGGFAHSRRVQCAAAPPEKPAAGVLYASLLGVAAGLQS